MIIPIFDENNFIQKITLQKNNLSKEYYAFYSSWLGGVTKNPRLMLLPIDDHMVHRGDGVFEAMKAVNRSVYLMKEHLERLFNSANKISLNPSFDIDYVKEIVLETLRIANKNDASIRVFLSRGPGNFSANPYCSIEPQLYVVIYSLKSPSPEKYENGVVIGKSDIPPKSSWIAQVKSCNYLPNALMNKEAVDRGLDFVIGIDSDGLITEGPTENIIIVDQNETIIHPPLNNILKGTTMIRACELARGLGMKTAVKSISINDLQSAREVMITGTTQNVLPVVKFENCKIGNGQPGTIAKKLNELIISDIQNGNCSVAF
jgi:4-amino-4-deoxychorismate lyase